MHEKTQRHAGNPRAQAAHEGLHECRHTFARLLIAAGVNAKAITSYLGHSSIQTTFDLYGDPMRGNEDASGRDEATCCASVKRDAFFQIDIAFGDGQPDATLVWRRYGHLYPGNSKQAAVALHRYPTAARKRTRDLGGMGTGG